MCLALLTSFHVFSVGNSTSTSWALWSSRGQRRAGSVSSAVSTRTAPRACFQAGTRRAVARGVMTVSISCSPFIVVHVHGCLVVVVHLLRLRRDPGGACSSFIQCLAQLVRPRLPAGRGLSESYLCECGRWSQLAGARRTRLKSHRGAIYPVLAFRRRLLANQGR